MLDRFAPVLPDFDYLRDSAEAERAIEASPALVALDDEFREVQFRLPVLLQFRLSWKNPVQYSFCEFAWPIEITTAYTDYADVTQLMQQINLSAYQL